MRLRRKPNVIKLGGRGLGKREEGGGGGEGNKKKKEVKEKMKAKELY